MLANQHLTLEQTKGFKGILIILEACSKDLEININRHMQHAGNMGAKLLHETLHRKRIAAGINQGVIINLLTGFVVLLFSTLLYLYPTSLFLDL